MRMYSTNKCLTNGVFFSLWKGKKMYNEGNWHKAASLLTCGWIVTEGRFICRVPVAVTVFPECLRLETVLAIQLVSEWHWPSPAVSPSDTITGLTGTLTPTTPSSWLFLLFHLHLACYFSLRTGVLIASVWREAQCGEKCTWTSYTLAPFNLSRCLGFPDKFSLWVWPYNFLLVIFKQVKFIRLDLYCSTTPIW